MPFELEHFSSGKIGLVAVCDSCGSRIEEGNMAILAWKSEESKGVGTRCGFKLFCKATGCDRKADGFDYWQEVDMAIYHLVLNTNANLADAAKRSKILDRMLSI